MIKTKGIYHTSIPVDDLDRAERFYTEVLGLELDRPRREGAGLSRLKCGSDTLVLFKRPRALERDSHKEAGAFHRIIERDSGRTIYFWDTEGNYEELHAGHTEAKA